MDINKLAFAAILIGALGSYAGLIFDNDPLPVSKPVAPAPAAAAPVYIYQPSSPRVTRPHIRNDVSLPSGGPH